jgi:hypothetical protein
MSYQKSRAIRTTGLKDLILDRTFAGQGLGKSIVSSIKDKTVASVKGVTEKFDPLNIATAFGGSLGGYAMGKLTGRSSEDISYFTGRRVGGAKKNNNPLVTKVSNGDKRPTRKGEGLADILARIFNLLKNRMLELKKEQEVTANFEEEKEDERELRHKEIINAISNMGLGPTATPVASEKPDKGMFSKLLNMMKNMIEKAFNAIKPALEFVGKLMKALGSNAVKFIKFLAAFGSEAALAFLFPAAVIVALKLLGDKQKEDIRKNPFDERWKNSPYARIVRKEFDDEREAAAFNVRRNATVMKRPVIESLVKSPATDVALMAQTGATRGRLTQWLKDHPEPTARWQAPVRNDSGQIVMGAGNYEDAQVIKPAKNNLPGAAHLGAIGYNYQPAPNSPVVIPTNTPNAAPMVSRLPRALGADNPFVFSQPQNLTPPRAVTPFTTTSAAMPSSQVSALTGRMQNAQRTNIALNMEDDAAEPIIIDKSKIINSGGSSGGLDILQSAPIRTDNRTLKGIQKQNIRFGPVVALA